MSSRANPRTKLIPKPVLRKDRIETRFIGPRTSFDIRTSTFKIPPRPYQVHAVQHMVKCIDDDNGNGYTKTLLCFMQFFIVSNRDRTYDDADDETFRRGLTMRFPTPTLSLNAA